MPLGVSVRTEGIPELERALQELPQMWDVAIEDFAETLRSLVLGRTPVFTTALKKSWSEVTREAGGFTFGTDLDYAEILEEGGYTRVGPRTVSVAGGIYSRQAPGGIIGPIVDDAALINRLAEEVVKEIERGIESVT